MSTSLRTRWPLARLAVPRWQGRLPFEHTAGQPWFGMVSTAARRILFACLLLSLGHALPAETRSTGRPPTGDAALGALDEGQVGEAQRLLEARLAAEPGDATAHQLLCRVFYAEDLGDAAIRQCELATAADPTSSDDQLWLGRAYGLKARHTGPFAALALARKVQSSFSRAVQLDPENVAAWNDLGEYYVNAPSIVNGGNDKAHALAARMMPQFPAAAHRLLGLIAVDERNASMAEAEFRQAVATAPHPAEAWIDLAHFYQSHDRPDEALAAVRSAIAADRAHGPVLVDAASILTDAHRAPDLAERCLRDYLNGQGKSDDAPAFKVHLQLSRLLASRGDTSGAAREIDSAHALAPTFPLHGHSLWAS